MSPANWLESYQAASLVLARGLAAMATALWFCLVSTSAFGGIIGLFPAAKVTLHSNCYGSVVGDGTSSSVVL